MINWTNTQDGKPDTETECIVAVREHDLVYTHKTFVQYDGKRWVDANGDEINGVIAWTKAPEYNMKAAEAMNRLLKCLENDKCETKDCCYFAALDLIAALLKAIKE